MNGQVSQILSVDEDINTSEWIRLILDRAKVSYSLTEVGTGSEAFELLSREFFDLCIFDYALPDMTGVQLCLMLRKMGCTTPVMFFSAMNRAVDRTKARDAGAIAYLAKPEEMDIFTETVSRLLWRQKVYYAEQMQFSGLSKAA